ncbi:choloylglycine hydrolase [Azorhizobium oxalatiphilum]|uniref:Choloylglycine hydrolase n=1 Tax=Azorhizobium oxalatiphilum TaxID=980631 RepID=A0A917BYZ0_9HYPH|nr:choloylglycine hydrolase family protein [Azorhizobium oxalatiphilum]GGF62587.1 choloylglycine hydrolase [Azorhizobium oxalatiphilum]
MLRTLSRSLALATACAIALASPGAQACTSFILRAADEGVVYGRTMEFGLPLQSQLTVIPRKLAISATGPDGTAGAGLQWTSKYGATGANALGLPVLVDGMNEAGLAGGLLYLPSLAEYQEVAPSEARNSIASFELLTYALTNFATVAEVKDALGKIKVSRAPQAVFKAAVPVHMTLHDATGASIVVEYIGGKLNIHDNPLGVLTNAPSFDWHIANLGNYLPLSAYDPKPLQVGSLTITPPSTGSGAPGLPGDMSAPARFVRAFLYSRAAPTLPTSTDAVGNAFHILNNFDIAPGIIRTEAGASTGGGVAGIETTEWSAVADTKTKRYYLRTYADSQSRMIDLTKADLDAKAIRYIPIDKPGVAQDLSR